MGEKMQTQISCPNCGTPYMTEVHQIVDSKRTPDLKMELLSGSLNMAVCPQCGAGGPLSTILLFHDTEYEKFIVHVPAELNISHDQREEMIGRLARQVMEMTPQEERRAYMFQPRMMLNMQTFMEEVLETEGITKEMIARQKKQSELLQTLLRADRDVQDHLLQERAGEIDETFFAMLNQFVEQAKQMNDDTQLLPMLNLRARLMTGTAVGRRLEAQQIAVHKMSQAAKKANGLSPEMLLDHVLANQETDHIVDALVSAGQGALRYEFFSALTAEIDKQEAAGDKAAAGRLTAIRERLVQLYETLQAQSQQIMQGSLQTLETILAAENKEQALQANAANIDDNFMAVLMARLQEAEQQGDEAGLQGLSEIYDLIVQQMTASMPEDIQFLNDLVRQPDQSAQEALMQSRPDLVTAGLIDLIDQVLAQGGQGVDETVRQRLDSLKGLINAQLLAK
jgi:hypothetical protein